MLPQGDCSRWRFLTFQSCFRTPWSTLMNQRRLFVASCIALVTSAFSFMIRQDIADPLAFEFVLTKQLIGAAMGTAFLGMAIAMLVVAPLCDWLGMGKVLLLAWLCHLTGILGTVFAPELSHVESVQNAIKAFTGLLPDFLLAAPGSSTGFWVLAISTFLVGCGNGLVEIA